METYFTLPSGKIIYKVKGQPTYSLYAQDGRTFLTALSEEDLATMILSIDALVKAENEDLKGEQKFGENELLNYAKWLKGCIPSLSSLEALQMAVQHSEEPLKPM